MCGTGTRGARAAWSGVLVAILAGTALAQDYTITTPTSLYEAPPSGAANVPGVSGDDSRGGVTIPFDFPYYGSSYNSASVCTNGYIQVGGGTSTAYSNGSFPVSSAQNGMIAPYWDDLYVVGNGSVKSWTSGVAPNRKFVVHWDRVTHLSQQSVVMTFQIQLYEGSGRIVFAYNRVGTTWTTANYYYTVGIDSAADTRYMAPNGNGYFPQGVPATDYQFDPFTTNYTGRVLYDRLVADENGVGNAVEGSLPLRGMRVELRAGTAPVGIAYADENGDFQLKGIALNSTQSGSVVVASETPAASVRTGAGGAFSTVYTLVSSVPFSSGSNLGTRTIGASADASGSVRAPLHVAAFLETVRLWAANRTAKPIPQLAVLYDTGSTARSSYTAGAAPSMRVGNAASGNADAWDNSVLVRVYGRHVLASLAGNPTVGYDDRFDEITDQENAFAEAFGYYLHSVFSGLSIFPDSTGATTGTWIDLESPTLAARAGPDVAGWVTASVHDLIDGANEPWDLIDGTGAATERPFTIVETLSAPVTAEKFYNAWGQLGFPGAEMSRIFIRHGVLGDDGLEPNDLSIESSALGSGGVRRANLVLNPYNEDWFSLVLVEPTQSLEASVNFNRALVDATISLEIRSALGAVLATGVADGAFGRFYATTGPLTPGTYHVCVRHDAGARIPDYAIQAFSRLTLSSDGFVAWTVDRPYNVPLDVGGGIGPFSLSIEQGERPPGLLIDSANLRITGTPSEMGRFDFLLSVRDSADPANVASVAARIEINDVLRFALPEFIAFAQGKVVSRPGQTTGGTPPLTFTPGEGDLPPGIAMAPGTFRFEGTPTTPGSALLQLDGTDVAGSMDSGETTVVVCPPYAPGGEPTGLAAGDAACGFWFDALAGSVASFSAKTSKNQPKRALRAFVLDPDWTQVTEGRAKAGNGKASVTGFPCAKSGRYFCIVASEAGEATLVGASMKLTPSKSGSGSVNRLRAGELLDVSFAGFAGTDLTFTVKPDRSGLSVRPAYLRSPSGAFTPILEGDFQEHGHGFSFKRELGETGVWLVRAVAKPGPQGALKWSYKLNHPQGATYSAD